MQVGGVSVDLMLIMPEQAFGEIILTDHSFLSLESVGWRTGCTIFRFMTHVSVSRPLVVIITYIHHSFIEKAHQ